MAVNQFNSDHVGNNQASEADTQSLARIKQILFGESLSDVLQQIQDLDSRLNQRLLAIESRVDEQLALLNQRLSSDIDGLRQDLTLSLESQHQAHQEQCKKLELSAQSADHALGTQLESQDLKHQAQFEENQSSFQRLAENVSQQDQRFQDRVQQLHAAMETQGIQFQHQLTVQCDELFQELRGVRDTHDGLKTKLSQSLTQLAQNL